MNWVQCSMTIPLVETRSEKWANLLLCLGSLFSLGGFFSLGSSSLFSLGGFFGLGSSLATAAARGLLGRSLLVGIKKSLVVVDELDKASLGIVAKAVAQLEDASVTTWTVGNLLGDVVEQLAHGLLALQVAEHLAARSGVVLLGAVDDGLGIDAQSLSLGHSGGNLLVKDQRNGHVGKHGVAMTFLTA